MGMCWRVRCRLRDCSVQICEQKTRPDATGFLFVQERRVKVELNFKVWGLNFIIWSLNLLPKYLLSRNSKK